MAPPLGLYVHIPWCPTRCIYCDFNTYVDGSASLKSAYHQALLKEIREAGAALGRPLLETIFFGGGTPTTLEPSMLLEIIKTVRAHFDLQPTAEITTEANPGTLSLPYLRALREGGINRLSLGVQSFNDEELRLLSRLHNSQTARDAVRLAREAGFENLSLDLIFNLPNQPLDRWVDTLEAAIALDPDHLSIYSLIVEPGTPMHRLVARGELPEPDDDLAAEMYATTIARLEDAGYTHYEISNWARRGREAEWESPHLASTHNLIYWRNRPYLGVGAGAFSTMAGERWANLKRPQRYIESVQRANGLAPARAPRTEESIPPQTALAEHMMLGLRLLCEGVSAKEVRQRFGVSLETRFTDAIHQGMARGLLSWLTTPDGDRRLRLTPQGRFLANQATLPFLED